MAYSGFVTSTQESKGNMTLAENQQIGFEWVRVSIFSIEPRWTVDLNLDSIKNEASNALWRECSQVTLLAQGAFNKLYTVQAGSGISIMRITLPVDPYWKTASEVATLEWLRQNTAIKVPEVLAHKTSRDNEIGFEWILMTRIPGGTLSDA